MVLQGSDLETKTGKSTLKITSILWSQALFGVFCGLSEVTWWAEEARGCGWFLRGFENEFVFWSLLSVRLLIPHPYSGEGLVEFFYHLESIKKPLKMVICHHQKLHCLRSGDSDMHHKWYISKHIFVLCHGRSWLWMEAGWSHRKQTRFCLCPTQPFGKIPPAFRVFFSFVAKALF